MCTVFVYLFYELVYSELPTCDWSTNSMLMPSVNRSRDGLGCMLPYSFTNMNTNATWANVSWWTKMFFYSKWLELYFIIFYFIMYLFICLHCPDMIWYICLDIFANISKHSVQTLCAAVTDYSLFVYWKKFFLSFSFSGGYSSCSWLWERTWAREDHWRNRFMWGPHVSHEVVGLTHHHKHYKYCLNLADFFKYNSND